MGIGGRISERLTQLGMSQAELARRTGLTQPTISGLVRGVSRSSVHLHTIARELSTTAAWLSGDTDDVDAEFPDEALSGDERQMLQLARQLNAKDQKAIGYLIYRLAEATGATRESPTLHDNRIPYRAAG